MINLDQVADMMLLRAMDPDGAREKRDVRRAAVETIQSYGTAIWLDHAERVAEIHAKYGEGSIAGRLAVKAVETKLGAQSQTALTP